MRGSRRSFLLASKAERYIGLCIRAGRLACGFNALDAVKKDVYLLILCSSASENAKKSALKLKNKFGCELLEYSGGLLEDVTGKPNCKIAAVREKNLAKAILSVTDDNLKIYSGGNG